MQLEVSIGSLPIRKSRSLAILGAHQQQLMLGGRIKRICMPSRNSYDSRFFATPGHVAFQDTMQARPEIFPSDRAIVLMPPLSEPLLPLRYA